MEVDVEKEALADIQPIVDSMSTNLTTFSGHGGKLIFYHGDSDPWFSPLDTFGYYRDLSAANGGIEAVSNGASSILCRAWRTAAVAPASISLIFWCARQLGGKGNRADVSHRDWQCISRTQSTALPLSEARALQGPGRYTGRE